MPLKRLQMLRFQALEFAESWDDSNAVVGSFPLAALQLVSIGRRDLYSSPAPELSQPGRNIQLLSRKDNDGLLPALPGCKRLGKTVLLRRKLLGILTCMVLMCGTPFRNSTSQGLVSWQEIVEFEFCLEVHFPDAPQAASNATFPSIGVCRILG